MIAAHPQARDRETVDFRAIDRHPAISPEPPCGRSVMYCPRTPTVDADIPPAYLFAMLKNRSVPADIMLPHITYANLAEAIDWLTSTFGFVEHYRYGDPIQGAQLHLGNAFIMVNSARPGRSSPAGLGSNTQSLTVFVEDVEAHYARARGARANIVEELHETGYGELQYGVEDLEGHHWLFSRHAYDVSPEAWGATVVNALE